MSTYQLISNTKIPRLASFLNAIRRDDPVAILYDDDADGLCAASLLYTYLARFGMRSILTIAKRDENRLFSQEFTDRMRASRIKTLFVLDFEPVNWGMLTPQALVNYPLNLVVFDHHEDRTKTYDHCVSMMQRLFVHPLNCTNTDNAGQYCTTKLVYDVLSSLSKMTDLEWKVLPGMISDMNYIAWGPYVQKIAAQNGVVISDADRSSWFTNPFGDIARRMNNAAGKGGAAFDPLLGIYNDAQTIADAYTKLPVDEKAEQFTQEFLSSFEKMAQFDAATKTHIIELPSEEKLGFSITSSISSIASFIHADKTLLVYQLHKNGYIHVSVRSQFPRIHLGELMRGITQGLQGANGGGHSPAAGARVRQEDFAEFMNRYTQVMSTRQVFFEMFWF